MGRKWTEEEKEVLRERLAKARAAKTAKTGGPEAKPPQVSSEENLSALMRHVQELTATVQKLQAEKAATPPPQTAGQQPQYNMFGQLIGTLEKYNVDPKNYPDPRAELAQEARLQRFAFPLNYELGWEVQTTTYQTKDGMNIKEPRFILELRRIVMDEDTGDPTNGRYSLRKIVFHEDPQAALVVARENGLEVDTANEAPFLHRMRYLRMRDWLLEAFYPPKPAQEKKNKREMVIGNRLVEFFEINSENSETIPFNELKTKV